MPATGYAALVAGLLVCGIAAAAAAAPTEVDDPAMAWEGRVAAGFGALVVGAPLWLAQLVLTVIAVRHDGPGWLWAWLAGAPLLGALVAGPVLARLRAGRPQPAPAPPPLEATARFAADQAWADFAEPDDRWHLCRSAPLPSAWPPRDDGEVLWLLYAERQDQPTTYEISAPWGLLRLSPGEGTPVAELLAGGLAVIGIQAAQPLSPRELGRRRPVITAEMIRAGEPAVDLAAGLEAWRALNGTIASHPLVAEHLPPRRGSRAR